MEFSSSLIEPQELYEALQDEALIILDCTIDKVDKSLKGTPLELIPNSLFFDIEGKLSDPKSKLPHTLIKPQQYEEEMQQLGINQDSTVVLYDRWGVYSSPRAWWMFKVMGFDSVYILNGGLPLWKKNKYPLVKEYAHAKVKGNFMATFREEYYADKEYVLAHYKNKEVDIFDARSKGRFTGLVPEPRKGLKGGHIPHSKNIPFEEVLDGETYKSKEEIASIFQHHLNGNEQIFTCGSGITASILAFASHLIGQQKLRVYDGSWAEWGIEELNLPTEL